MPNYKVRNCAVCNQEFFPTSPRQKTCTLEDCCIKYRRISEKRRYDRNKTIYERECPFCNVTFSTSDSKKIYCGSKSCEQRRVEKNCGSAKRPRTIRRERGLSIEYINNMFLDRGWELITKEYVDNKQLLEFICNKGHKGFITWGHFHSGTWCVQCAGLKKKTLNEIVPVFLSEGYTVLDGEYINAQNPINLKCPAGHFCRIRWNDFRRGYRCGHCFGNKSPSMEDIRGSFTAQGFELVSDDYVNNKTPLRAVCSNGHGFDIRWDSFVSGRGCPICSASFKYSKQEKEIARFVSGLVPEVEENARNIIPPHELDIYISSKKLAIEYCGLHWHGELSSGKPRDYHYRKMEECGKKGIRLITIFEDEYIDKPEVVKSRIRNALGCPEKRIFARKLKFGLVSPMVSKDFMLRYHLQGNTKANFHFGLFDGEDNVIQIMTFGPLSRTHTGLGFDGKVVEMKRFASLPGSSVVAGASKLLKHASPFLKDAGYSYIKSYCDMRFASLEPVYEKLGFYLQTFTKYTPHYFKGQKRVRNQGLRKTPEERLTGKTEWELRKEEGYDRIWDCGHRTYVLNIHDL